MKIQEYQAKEIFRRYGIPTLAGRVAKSAEEAREAATALGGGVLVLKAQVLLGGRGKGRFKEHGQDGPGGVNVVKGGADEIEATAGKMLGSTLVTAQGEARVDCLYVEAGCRIAKEFYAAIVVDRTVGQAVLMASTEGGMDIEEVAATAPEKILRVAIDPVYGLFDYQARKLAHDLGFAGKPLKKAAALLTRLSKLFHELDVSLAEINPLVLTEDDDVVALDGKMAFDENALFRHQDVLAGYASSGSEEDADAETAASRLGMSYVKLDGDVGCLVNGAGLAMGTMDIIKHCGGSPANFLDVGGGANAEKVTAAFRIILRDPNVKAILVNIFGGIVHCDMIAEGVMEAVKAVGLEVPLVVRLEGTNAKEGRELLAQSGLKLQSATSMADAAEKIVAAAKGATS